MPTIPILALARISRPSIRLSGSASRTLVTKSSRSLPKSYQGDQLFITVPIRSPKEWMSLTRGTVISARVPARVPNAAYPPKQVPVAVWKPPTEDDSTTILLPFRLPPTVRRPYEDSVIHPVCLQIVRDLESGGADEALPHIDKQSTMRFTVTHVDLTNTIKLPKPPGAYKLLVPGDNLPYLGKVLLNETSIKSIDDHISKDLPEGFSQQPTATADTSPGVVSSFSSSSSIENPEQQQQQQPMANPSQPAAVTTSLEEQQNQLETATATSASPSPPSLMRKDDKNPKGQSPRLARLLATSIPHQVRLARRPPPPPKELARFYVFTTSSDPTAQTLVQQRLAAECISKIFHAAEILPFGRVHERQVSELKDHAALGKGTIRNEVNKARRTGILFFRDYGYQKLADGKTSFVPAVLASSKVAVQSLHKAATYTKKPLVVVLAGTEAGMDTVMKKQNQALFEADYWRYEVWNFDEPAAEVEKKVEAVLKMAIGDVGRSVAEAEGNSLPEKVDSLLALGAKQRKEQAERLMNGHQSRN